MKRMTVDEFVEKTSELLERERAAEIEETKCLQEQLPLKELQRRGVCLLKLQVSSHYTGLYGRNVLVLTLGFDNKELPSHNFTPGDIAGLQFSLGAVSPGDLLASGVVSRVMPNAIHVAFEESYDQLDLDDRTQYKLLKLANDVTYKRLKKCLADLGHHQSSANRKLVSVLFGEIDPGPPLSKARDDINLEVYWYNQTLDDSQKEAVEFALGQRDIGIIHGPPGTGKTTTVTEVILQEVKRGNKLLVCAPSNIAVDNLVEKLSLYKTRMIRLGHPARVLPSIQGYSLDAILLQSDETKLVTDVRKDIDQSLVKMKKTRDKGEKHRLRDDLRHLRKELRVREEKAIKEILQRSDVILCTLTMASNQGPLKHLDNSHFDLVVIDECSQATEVACWIALQQGNRCLLAGDHNQLPPTIISHSAAKDGLALTLMERLLSLYGADIMRMLTTQYRMHQDIMIWPSEQLYHGKLKAHESVATHLLKGLDGVSSDADLSSIPLLMIDTAGCEMTELTLVDEVSKGNEGEADIVSHHVDLLVQIGLKPTDIAVIAPYNLQVELLRVRLSQKYPGIEIKSVDGFQGREKEAVIISLVRSNDKGIVGFLAEDRRINVAITRARRHLAIVCDSETVSHHPFLKAMVEYFTEKGEVRSAQQYIHDGALDNDYKRPEHIEEQIISKPVTKKLKDPEQNDKKVKQVKNITAKIEPTQQKAGVQNATKTTVDSGKENTYQSEWRLDVIQKYISKLMISKVEQTYAFPATLDGSERRTVHEICEKLGLQHESVGTGRDRHIVISKPDKSNPDKSKQYAQKPDKSRSQSGSIQEATTQNEKQEIEENMGNTKMESELSDPIDIDIVTCGKCGKSIPGNNFELHLLRCPVSNTNTTLNKSSAKLPKKTKNSKKKSEQATAPEDFDSLIADAVRQNTTCSIPKCKNNAATLGTNCPFCSKRFCLAHNIAEAHGCGDAAKAQARATISREGKLYRGSGVPSKKPDPTKRAHLERKFNKKLEELSEQRKHKKKEK